MPSNRSLGHRLGSDGGVATCAAGGRLDDHGAEPLTPRQIASLVRRSRGEHELDADFAAAAEAPADQRVAVMEQLVSEHEDDPRVRFELARALDAAGRCEEAIVQHEEALRRGLREPQRFVSLMERALAAHTAGRHEQAFAWATELSERYDDSTAAAALAVLTGADHSFTSVVVLEWRLPRIVAALVIGAALGGNLYLLINYRSGRKA